MTKGEGQVITSVKKVKMGYNFTIRPHSLHLGKRDRDEYKTTEIDRYLTKIRKLTKFQ